jgi:hypothetical protein
MIRSETARLLTRALQLRRWKEHVGSGASGGDEQNMINPWTYVRFTEAREINSMLLPGRYNGSWQHPFNSHLQISTSGPLQDGSRISRKETEKHDKIY